jgi:hypothetical protein
VQRRSAGHQDLQAGRGRQQLGHLPRRPEHLLEVVEHQQQPLLPQGVPDALEQRPLPGLAHPERLGDRACDTARVADRGQVDEQNAVFELVQQTRR